MKWFEQEATPHVVYRMRTSSGELLYVGYSSRALCRIGKHLLEQPWAHEVDRVDIEWHGCKVDALKAEGEAIRTETPLHNKLVPTGRIRRPGRPRGDGLSCPKCHNPKDNPKRPYCTPCRLAYNRNWKLARGWVPKPPTSKLVCPRCKGEKLPEQSYCKPCRRVINRDYSLRRKKNRSAALTES